MACKCGEVEGLVLVLVPGNILQLNTRYAGIIVAGCKPQTISCLHPRKHVKLIKIFIQIIISLVSAM